MDSIATFVIPIAHYHLKHAYKAIASVRAQTIPSTIITAVDMDGRGAGYARNRALELVQTPFVVFLDADDEVHPQFVEKTFAMWREGFYTYTDWQQGNRRMHSDKPWIKGDWHVVTTLLPTAYVRMVGGFDESWHGGEDSLFYYALTRAGVCGIRVPEVLFNYGAGGKRAHAFVGSPEHQRFIKHVIEKYEDHMACCGDTGPMENPPTNDPQPGDVLAMATWNGNRQERGRATGRHYPRTGNGKQEWVSPLDVKASPHLWRIVEAVQLPPVVVPQIPIPSATPPPPGVVATADGAVLKTYPEPVHGIEEIAAALYPGRERAPEPVTLETIQAVPRAKAKPNAAKVRKLAQKAKKSA